MNSPQEPSYPTQDEARRANVLMEKMLSEFRTFGEGLTIVRERVERIEPKLDKVSEDVELLKFAVRQNSADIRQNSEDIRKNSEDIRGNSDDIRSIRVDLKQFNQRLLLVESKFPS